MTDARAFHEATNHAPEDVHAADTRDPGTMPRPTKRYRDRRFVDLDRIEPPWDPTLSILAERDDPLDGAAQTERTTLDVESIGTLCYEAMGITNEVERDGRQYRFRAASCTGKLYHVECYVVCDDRPGLPAGVYHFDPAQFGFDVIRQGDVRGVLARAVGDTTERTEAGTAVSEAPVTIVTTSNWWRNAWKYADRTYRHAFWDSGTVLANLLATVHGLSLPASVVTAFADHPVAELLGVDPTDEAPLSLVPIGDGEPAPRSRSVERIDPDVVPPSSDPGSVAAIYEAWAESTLSDGAAARAWRDLAAENRGLGRSSPGDGERVALEPVDHETASARPLHPVVVRRGSCRSYAERGPTRRQLGTVLDRATRGVPGDWNGGTGDGFDYLTAYVLATGVDGVPDGTYHYHPDEDALERLGDVDPETKIRLALDQRWAGDAHVNVYLLANVEAIVETLGNRGYRLAQLEAGLTLGRLYLATYAHRELGGVGLTFFDGLVSDHLSPRAAGQSPMTLFAFGRRAE